MESLLILVLTVPALFIFMCILFTLIEETYVVAQDKEEREDRLARLLAPRRISCA